MPLPEPSLDNRRFDQLVGEGRALIPRLAPQWTDHNASDPGITLLELAAWLSEQNIYRFDRVSEEALRAFVRLVGIEPRPPGVARTVVSIRNDAAGLPLPERLQLGRGDVAAFESTAPMFASPARLTTVLSGTGASTETTALNARLEEFAPFGVRPRPGAALHIGFDRALDAAGATLSLHVWTSSWQQDGATRAALLAEQDASRPAEHCPKPDWRAHYRVTTIWEYYAGADRWLPLQDVVDETRALSLSGFVRFSAPVGHQPGGPGSGFFIRCRIVRGRFECPPRLRHVAFNAVPCEHALSRAERKVGDSSGHAAAAFALGESPIVAGSVRLVLDDGAGDVQSDWLEAPDFERAGPHERAFVLDPERGILRGGDGLRARILPAGYLLRASYRAGGGIGGNVAAGDLTSVPVTPENVALLPALPAVASQLGVIQPFAAEGGGPRETLAAAQARAFDAVHAVDKAVTLEDIERLALATPGVPLARVRAVALDARLPCYPAPGVITVIAIPRCPRPAPLPSRALLDAVERYLEPRRLVTSEIHAIAPHYRRVAVRATLHLSCDAPARQTLLAAAARIDAFLDPLEGGPNGDGWPFGRTVYRSEIMALLHDTPGVARVTALTLESGCAGCAGGSCDNVELCAHELVIPGRHQLLAESEIARNLKRSDAHDCEHA